MLFVLASLASLFLAPATGQGLVEVGFYGEALCPDCINFIDGPLTVAFKEVLENNFDTIDEKSRDNFFYCCTFPLRLDPSSLSTMHRGETPSS